MADVLTSLMTSVVASPPVPIPNGKLGGVVQVATATYGGTTAADGNIVYFLPLPVDCRLFSLKGFWTAVASGVVEVGLFTPDGDGTYTAVDADLFASSLDISSANLVGTELLYEAGNILINEHGTKLWEMAGASARPNYDYYVLAVTLTTAGTWSSDILTLQALYTKE